MTWPIGVSIGGQCPAHYQPLGTCCELAVRYQPVRDLAALEAAISRAMAIDPEDHATKSRDYGRGFADAIRRVREALGHA